MALYLYKAFLHISPFIALMTRFYYLHFTGRKADGSQTMNTCALDDQPQAWQDSLPFYQGHHSVAPSQSQGPHPQLQEKGVFTFQCVPAAVGANDDIKLKVRQTVVCREKFRPPADFYQNRKMV